MPLACELRVLGRNYPRALRELSAPPDPVWIQGELLAGPSIAIVGTRQPSEEARHYAQVLAYRLARRGVAVWSGGAIGIDAAAHHGALEGGGVTVAVVGTGLDHCYPAAHEPLYEAIVASGGALVSPFPRAQPATRYTFHQRNAVLAAMTLATVVVQAPLKSGARSTARHARQLKRPLFVVPSAPWDALGAGNLAEIQLGGRVLVDESRLFEALGPQFQGVSAPRAAGRSELPHGAPVARAALPLPAPEFDSAHAAAVFRATCPKPRHIDDLCSETGLGAPLVQQALLTLTLEAVLVEGPDGWYRRASS